MSQADDASLPSDREDLISELALTEAEQSAVIIELRRLMDAEDHEHGIFYAKEINELRQKKVMLEFQRQLRAARINRLNSW